MGYVNLQRKFEMGLVKHNIHSQTNIKETATDKVYQISTMASMKW